MKLFDDIKVRRNAPFFIMDEQHAIILILLETIFSDDWESKEQSLLLQQIIAKSPVFLENSDVDDLVVLEQSRRYHLAHSNSLEEAISYLSVPMQETAFAMACEIIFADGFVNEKEALFVEDLAIKMNISKTKARSMISTFEILYRSSKG